MIRLVTSQLEIYNSPTYSLLTADEAVGIIEGWKVIQFDTETSGVDPHLNKLLTMQFGNDESDERIVVDCLTTDVLKFKNVLESIPLIGHNLKFDLQFLYNYGIVPKKVYDTMITEQLLYLGYPAGRISFSLLNVAERYLGVTLDKSIRGRIAQTGLTDEVILYSANDVTYLEKILKAQTENLKKKKCVNAAKVENSVVPAMAYLEWCGVKLDEKAWKKKMEEDERKYNERRKVLDEFVVKWNEEYTKRVGVSSPYCRQDLQGDLFSGFDTSPKCVINWDSSKQVIPFCQALGFNTLTKDKHTGESKDTVLEKELKSQKGVNDEFLEVYFEYKEASKLISSFGQTHLDSINPATGRLHTKFLQLGASSGRMSCGGGNNEEVAKARGLAKGKSKYLNLQQLPHDAVTRACFCAEEGNLMVSCDFSSEEARLTADITGDKEYHKEFTERSGDTHAMFAWACYEDECRALGCKDASEVKSKAREWRNKVKNAEFAYTFNASAGTIAKTAGISLEKAEQMVKRLDAFFSGLTSFRKKASAEVQKLGYVLINPITGHKVWWWDHDKWLEKQRKFTPEFWEDYRRYHKGTGDPVNQMVRNAGKAADKYGKLGLNARTQGTGAIILKETLTRLFSWIVENGFFEKIKICVAVHDELVCEFPEEMKEFPEFLENLMSSTASIYCKSLEIPAEASVGKCWIH